MSMRMFAKSVTWTMMRMKTRMLGLDVTMTIVADGFTTGVLDLTKARQKYKIHLQVLPTHEQLRKSIKLHHFSLEHNSFDTHLTNNQLLTTKILLLKPRNSLSDIDS